MTPSLVLSIVTALLIPLFWYAIRGARNWTKIEVSIDQLRQMNAELIAQAREDRQATNARLRWLEENSWRNGGKNNAV